MTKLKSRSLALLLCTALIPTNVFAAKGDNAADSNMPAGARAAMAPAAAGAISNHGHFVCTAAINANGTVFSGEYVDALQTQHLSTGTYQVVFNTTAVSTDAPCGDIRIALGWYRVCQPDTLWYGTLPARICTVANRAGSDAGVWVQIYDANGNLVDTPFTLSVSR